MEECAVCHSDITDKVFMTCSAKHPFCFGCVLKNIEVTNELKSCPSCRGGKDKYILVDKYPDTITEDFYSLFNFKKSIPILQRIMSEEISPNSCLISESILVNYTRNKKQLEITNKLIGDHGYKLEEIFPLIKYYNKQSINNTFAGLDLVNEFFNNGGMNAFIPPPPNYPPPSSNTSSRPRSSDIFSMFSGGNFGNI